MKTLRLCVLSYPAVLLLALATTWIAGRISLGYWPRPSLDDPGQIGILVDIPYFITCLLIVLGLPAFSIGILWMLCDALRDKSRKASLFITSALATLCMITAVLILQWDLSESQPGSWINSKQGLQLIPGPAATFHARSVTRSQSSPNLNRYFRSLSASFALLRFSLETAKSLRPASDNVRLSRHTRTTYSNCA